MGVPKGYRHHKAKAFRDPNQPVLTTNGTLATRAAGGKYAPRAYKKRQSTSKEVFEVESSEDESDEQRPSPVASDTDEASNDGWNTDDLYEALLEDGLGSDDSDDEDDSDDNGLAIVPAKTAPRLPRRRVCMIPPGAPVWAILDAHFKAPAFATSDAWVDTVEEFFEFARTATFAKGLTGPWKQVARDRSRSQVWAVRVAWGMKEGLMRKLVGGAASVEEIEDECPLIEGTATDYGVYFKLFKSAKAYNPFGYVGLSLAFLGFYERILQHLSRWQSDRRRSLDDPSFRPRDACHDVALIGHQDHDAQVVFLKMCTARDARGHKLSEAFIMACLGTVHADESDQATLPASWHVAAAASSLSNPAAAASSSLNPAAATDAPSALPFPRPALGPLTNVSFPLSEGIPRKNYGTGAEYLAFRFRRFGELSPAQHEAWADYLFPAADGMVQPANGALYLLSSRRVDAYFQFPGELRPLDERDVTLAQSRRKNEREEQRGIERYGEDGWAQRKRAMRKRSNERVRARLGDGEFNARSARYQAAHRQRLKIKLGKEGYKRYRRRHRKGERARAFEALKAKHGVTHRDDYFLFDDLEPLVPHDKGRLTFCTRCGVTTFPAHSARTCERFVDPRMSDKAAVAKRKSVFKDRRATRKRAMGKGKVVRESISFWEDIVVIKDATDELENIKICSTCSLITFPSHRHTTYVGVPNPMMDDKRSVSSRLTEVRRATGMTVTPT